MLTIEITNRFSKYMNYRTLGQIYRAADAEIATLKNKRGKEAEKRIRELMSIAYRASDYCLLAIRYESEWLEFMEAEH